MKSRAQIKSHPIHPMLIPFPIAFLTGAFLFDLAGVLFSKPGFWGIGYYLTIIGVVSGVIAAVPGMLDYRYTVPPKSSGKKRALKHALTNTGALALFVMAWVLRHDPEGPPTALILVLEAGGVVCLTLGGWMGGTLVYRNQIGVDPRYAGAGKWKEARFDAEEGEPFEVAGAGELQVDQMKLLRVAHRRVVLARTEQGYVAFDDRCSHKGGSLAGGAMICGTVQCPWHGSQFDVGTGEVKAGPAEAAITAHSVEERGGKVYLRLAKD